jgi:hypothetical protein
MSASCPSPRLTVIENIEINRRRIKLSELSEFIINVYCVNGYLVLSSKDTTTV